MYHLLHILVLSVRSSCCRAAPPLPSPAAFGFPCPLSVWRARLFSNFSCSIAPCRRTFQLLPRSPYVTPPPRCRCLVFHSTAAVSRRAVATNYVQPLVARNRTIYRTNRTNRTIRTMNRTINITITRTGQALRDCLFADQPGLGFSLAGVVPNSTGFDSRALFYLITTPPPAN